MKKFYLLFLIFISKLIVAQTVTTDTTLTLDEVLESITTNLECTSISNISSPNNAQLHEQGFNSYGSFAFTDEPNFPFENGIVMTTADATDLTSISSPGGNNWPGDTDLEALIQQPGQTFNASVIEFDFVPFRGQLKVDYILASQEYPAFVCDFADTFAFIVSGPGISNVNDYDHDANPNTPEVSLDLGGLNIATLPGTNIPVNPTNVHLNDSCGVGTLGEFALSQFYDNQNSGNTILDFEGQIMPLTAEVDVTPGQTYHIKLVIGDRGDSILDSAVFIDADSFEIGTIPEDLPYAPNLPVALPECWNASESANFNLTDECSPNAENYLQLFGGNYSITTSAINAEGLSGLDISFDLLNGCEDTAEAGENLLIEYFDGTDWQFLDDIDPIDIPTPLNEASNNWLTYNYTITNGLSMNFMLKFSRVNGDDLQDDINIGNLSITNTTLSNDEFVFGKDIIIYPNPTKDLLNFQTQSSELITKIEIFDINGKLIDLNIPESSKDIKLNIAEYPAGIYLAKISSGKHYVNRKIIKR